MLISASRRTDIPAFYGEWLMNRLRDEFVLVANPFNRRQVKRVSLAPESVEAIIFWTRNAKPFMPYLSEIDTCGYRYSFHYTITGYPAEVEKATPGLKQATSSFCRLSDRLGPERVVWRYDPILLSNISDIDDHRKRFEKIAAALRGKTHRVTISFAEFYRKTRNNLNSIPGLIYSDISENHRQAKELIGNLAEIARGNGMKMQSCAVEMDLEDVGIRHGKCLDEKQLEQSFGFTYPAAKDPGQRALCNCVKSIDIGQYNTCLHGCLYCYATDNQRLAAQNRRRHDPASPILIGQAPGSPAASGPRQYRLF